MRRFAGLTFWALGGALAIPASASAIYGNDEQVFTITVAEDQETQND